ncbi:hypothetical protein ElyMa_003428700 [Elysia marginata]|uniref:Uncharacterized protein n=1 Tax=Elysia marginata TaxID=1093978 RepID=A0AAV4JSH3_9GAST|nr:hypothetical protein ElyMa_003428700 [Elysia marginata]
MCRNDKLGGHIVRYAKREFGGESDVASPAGYPLLDGSYNIGSDLSHGRKQRFSIAPHSALYRSIANARSSLEEPALPVQEKRDVEYWDGPAPADINA